MQQDKPASAIVIHILEEAAEGGVVFKIDGLNELALHLSVRQARTLAGDLIQYAHRIDVKKSLKQSAKAA